MDNETGREHALRALRVRGVVDEVALEVSSGVPARELGDVFGALVQAGLVRRRGTEWELTPSGLTAADSMQALPNDLVRAGPYQRFLPINDRFKRLCAAVQLSTAPKMDALPDGVIGEVDACYADVDALLVELSDVLVLSHRYRSRLAACMKDIRRGERASLLSPIRESVHSIWMELHEDLLLTFRQERNDDA